jgi:hypothetical protein
MTETGLVPATARWMVLDTLALPIQSYWTVPQIAGHTELAEMTVIRALTWLRAQALARFPARLTPATDPLYEITAAGRRALEPQLTLD